jgi:hypothetical protein
VKISRFSLAFILINYLSTPFLFSADREEKWPNGQLKKSYSVELDNKKSGAYKEFHENGQPKIQAFYKNNILEGDYFEFYDDGKKKQESQFSKGKKNGYFKIYDKGVLIKEEIWQDGALTFTFPKTIEEIKRSLTAIGKLKTEFIGVWPKDFKPERFPKTVEDDNIAGLTRLREYRYLSNLAYEDLQLNKSFIAHNLDAIIVLKKLGGVTHFPTNPGLPEVVFKSGYKGTSSSNLCLTFLKLTSSSGVDNFMDDTDEHNIDRVGHRRWCLSPAMKATGFAASDGYAVMWSINLDRTVLPDYDTVCYPAKGYMPSTHFKNNYAWSVSLNPKHYKSPEKSSIKVKVFSIKDNVKEELKIAYQNIDLSYIAITNCIIFQPEKISTAPLSRYQVTISGVKDIKNKETKIEYYVEFF